MANFKQVRPCPKRPEMGEERSEGRRGEERQGRLRRRKQIGGCPNFGVGGGGGGVTAEKKDTGFLQWRNGTD